MWTAQDHLPTKRELLSMSFTFPRKNRNVAADTTTSAVRPRPQVQGEREGRREREWKGERERERRGEGGREEGRVSERGEGRGRGRQTEIDTERARGNQVGWSSFQMHHLLLTGAEKQLTLLNLGNLNEMFTWSWVRSHVSMKLDGALTQLSAGNLFVACCVVKQAAITWKPVSPAPGYRSLYVYGPSVNREHAHIFSPNYSPPSFLLCAHSICCYRDR